MLEPTMTLGTMPSLKEDSLSGGTPRYRDIEAMAQTAEAAGFDSFWLADHVVFRSPEGENVGCWEAFTFLSALASVTSKIRRAMGAEKTEPSPTCSSITTTAMRGASAGA